MAVESITSERITRREVEANDVAESRAARFEPSAAPVADRLADTSLSGLAPVPANQALGLMTATLQSTLSADLKIIRVLVQTQSVPEDAVSVRFWNDAPYRQVLNANTYDHHDFVREGKALNGDDLFAASIPTASLIGNKGPLNLSGLMVSVSTNRNGPENSTNNGPHFNHPVKPIGMDYLTAYDHIDVGAPDSKDHLQVVSAALTPSDPAQKSPGRLSLSLLDDTGKDEVIDSVYEGYRYLKHIVFAPAADGQFARSTRLGIVLTPVMQASASGSASKQLRDINSQSIFSLARGPDGTFTPTKKLSAYTAYGALFHFDTGPHAFVPSAQSLVGYRVAIVDLDTHEWANDGEQDYRFVTATGQRIE